MSLASSGLSISFSLISLTLVGSWSFFGDTVVIIGETPLDQSLTHKLPDTPEPEAGNHLRHTTLPVIAYGRAFDSEKMSAKTRTGGHPIASSTKWDTRLANAKC